MIYEIYVNGVIFEVWETMQDAAARAIALEDELGEGNVDIKERGLTAVELEGLSE